MATFEDFKRPLKEPIEVDTDPNKRWTPQKVKLFNHENEFWGTFSGKFNIASADLSNVNVYNCTIYGPDGEKVNVNELISSANRVSAFVNDLYNLSVRVENLEETIKDRMIYKGILSSEYGQETTFRSLFSNDANKRLGLSGVLSTGYFFQYGGKDLNNIEGIKLNVGDAIIVNSSVRTDDVNVTNLDIVNSQDPDVVKTGLLSSISSYLNQKITNLSISVYGELSTCVRISGDQEIQGIKTFKEDTVFQSLLKANNISTQNLSIGGTFDIEDGKIPQSKIINLTSNIKTLSDDVGFLLSTGHDSMEYKRNLSSFGNGTLSDFFSQSAIEGRFKNGFMYHVSQNTSTLSDNIGNVIQFEENDYIIFNKNVVLSDVTVFDFDVIKDYKNTIGKVYIKNPETYLSNGQLEELSVVKIPIDQYKLSVINGTLKDNVLYIVSSDYVECYGQQICNITMCGDSYLGIAATDSYVNKISSDLENDIIKNKNNISTISTDLSSLTEDVKNMYLSCFVVDNLTSITLSNISQNTIAIVSSNSISNLSKRTAYIWNKVGLSGRWEALEGNYSAENIYFSKDMNFAGDYTLGVKKTTAEKTIKYQAGLSSLQNIMFDMFSQRKDPEVTYPTYNLSINNYTASEEVGDTYVVPGVKFTYTGSGTYQYNTPQSDTGVYIDVGGVVLSCENGLTTNGGILDVNGGIQIQNGTESIKYEDNSKTYTYFLSAHHVSGNVPLDNLGNACDPSFAISADIWKEGSVYNSKTATFTGYRKYFWGCLSSKMSIDDLDSSYIRTDSSSQDHLQYYGKTFDESNRNFTIKEGTKTIIFAAPENSKFYNKKVSLLDGSLVAIVVDNVPMSNKTVQVFGLNNYSQHPYNIWILSVDEPRVYQSDLSIRFA